MLIILNQKHFLYCIIFSDILLEKKIHTYGLLDKQQKQLFHKKLVISESYESSEQVVVLLFTMCEGLWH